MTLCLAATCEWNNEPTIVCCCDMTGVRDDVKSDTYYKIRWIKKSIVMLAGDLSAANELFKACEHSIAKYQSGGNDLAIAEMLSSLREAVGSYRRNLNHEYLTTKYGLTFGEFLKEGKSYFNEIDHVRIWAELKSLDLKAGLIVSTFSDDESVHVTISSDGRVAWVDNFAALGTGARICIAFLLHRDYVDSMPIDQCLYRVLEAKLAAERDPYVGKETNVLVYTPTKFRRLTRKGMNDILALIEERRAIPNFDFDQDILADPRAGEFA